MNPPFVLELTPNQRRLIADRYQRGAASPEAWLLGVSRNLALAEVVYALPPEGLRRLVASIPGARLTPSPKPGEAHRIALQGNAGLQGAGAQDDPEAACVRHERFLRALAQAAYASAELQSLWDLWTERFYTFMGRFRFLPNSPTLMNAGRRLQQLSACYVLPIPDRLDGIMDALKAQTLIHQSGGGTGFSFGRLRAAGSAVASTEGVAAGPLAFLELFDRTTEVIRQGGMRRGANMAVLPIDHPDVFAFVSRKRDPTALRNFNLSLGVTDAFFDAVERDLPWELKDVRGEALAVVPAKGLLRCAAEAAWASGDPGLVFLDRINEGASNPVPGLGPIESVNPCGEQPLYPNEPCNLGSLNLAAFVAYESSGAAKLDTAALERAVDLAVRLLDDVIAVNRYPLPSVDDRAWELRRIGLGVMGFAELLVALGIPYDAPEGVACAERAMGLISRRALAASERLGAARGVFPRFLESRYAAEAEGVAGVRPFPGPPRRPRHAARTTIAPTGTIAIAAGLQGAGIEPFFALAYARYTAPALDAIRRGEAPLPEHVYQELNPAFAARAEAAGYWGLGREGLIERLLETGGSARAIPAIPEAVGRLFPVAHDLSVEAHIRMQAAFQRHTDNAVSKTINLPNEATVGDVLRAFRLAFSSGLKGITVYRDGSKPEQVLRARPLPEGPPQPSGAACPSC